MQESAGLQVQVCQVPACGHEQRCGYVREYVLPGVRMSAFITGKGGRGLERNEAGEVAVGEGACTTSMWGGEVGG